MTKIESLQDIKSTAISECPLEINLNLPGDKKDVRPFHSLD
jgi:hypothetical protein